MAVNIKVKSKAQLVLLALLVALLLSWTLWEETPERLYEKTIQRRIKQAQCNSTSVMEGIQIFPSPQEKPFKRRVILTLLSAQVDQGPDYFYFSALLLTHSLIHNPRLQLPADSDTEVAIVVTENTDPARYQDFLRMGARVFVVQPIYVSKAVPWAERWRSCFTKLYLFKMAFYESIAYLDLDVLLLRPLVEDDDSIFAAVEKVRQSRNQTYTFGASQDVGLADGIFNAGVMVIQPSCHHFKRLVDLAPQITLYDSYFMEQGLLNFYFSDLPSAPGDVPWTRIPFKYNGFRFGDKEIIEKDRIALLHDKFWEKVGFKGNEYYQIMGWGMLQEVRDWQIQHFGSSPIP